MKFWAWLKSFLLEKPEEKKYALWHKLAAWTKEDKISHTISYVIYYYPEKHDVELYCEGHKWKDHDYYHQALHVYYKWQRAMLSYEKKIVMNYIERLDDIKEDVAKKSVENLEKELKQAIEKEDYKKAQQIQSEIEKRSGS